MSVGGYHMSADGVAFYPAALAPGMDAEGGVYLTALRTLDGDSGNVSILLGGDLAEARRTVTMLADFLDEATAPDDASTLTPTIPTPRDLFGGTR